jgi:predicted nucleic acid-binding protein
MVYLDTNILVYASINQDEAKRQTLRSQAYDV